jgi:hypothetical protein
VLNPPPRRGGDTPSCAETEARKLYKISAYAPKISELVVNSREARGELDRTAKDVQVLQSEAIDLLQVLKLNCQELAATLTDMRQGHAVPLMGR